MFTDSGAVSRRWAQLSKPAAFWNADRHSPLPTLSPLHAHDGSLLLKVQTVTRVKVARDIDTHIPSIVLNLSYKMQPGARHIQSLADFLGKRRVHWTHAQGQGEDRPWRV